MYNNNIERLCCHHTRLQTTARSTTPYGLAQCPTDARHNLKLPMFRHYKGIIALMLNPTDGVVRQTGVHRSHYTWWRTRQFQMSNLKMLQI